MRPLLTANHQLSVKFYSPGQFGRTDAADLVVLDEFSPKSRPRVPSLWIAPPRDGGPLPVAHVVEDAMVTNWHNDSSVGEGLHAKDEHISNAEVFEVFEGDIPVASVPEGPIAVARPASQTEAKMAVIGFDPLQGQLKFEVTTPILFANLLRWLAPESFRTLELSAGQVGAVTISLDHREHADRMRVTDENGFAVPFTIRPKALQLFASKPGLVRVVSDDRDRLISLTLPGVAEFEWQPPSNTARGLPATKGFAPVAVDLWKWLAISGAACLLAEWLLYGLQRATRFSKSRKSKPAVTAEAELVSK